MKSFNQFLSEKKLDKDKEDPCWDGYVKLGHKKKNGKKVPNCVPKEGNLCPSDEKMIGKSVIRQQHSYNEE